MGTYRGYKYWKHQFVQVLYWNLYRTRSQHSSEWGDGVSETGILSPIAKQQYAMRIKMFQDRCVSG